MRTFWFKPIDPAAALCTLSGKKVQLYHLESDKSKAAVTDHAERYRYTQQFLSFRLLLGYVQETSVSLVHALVRKRQHLSDWKKAQHATAATADSNPSEPNTSRALVSRYRAEQEGRLVFKKLNLHTISKTCILARATWPSIGANKSACVIQFGISASLQMIVMNTVQRASKF